MPGGKPAGVRCQHLSDDFACQLFETRDVLKFVQTLEPSLNLWGESAMRYAHRIVGTQT